MRGTAFGLQCTAAAPLDSVADLAAFYISHVRAQQPRPPYILLGYSFGAGVAFEMALQLERVRILLPAPGFPLSDDRVRSYTITIRDRVQEGCAVRLVLVDGSPEYVATHTRRGKSKRRTRATATDEADALAYFAQLFREIDAAHVSAELERLADWSERVDRTVALLAGAASYSPEALAQAAHSFYRKLVMADRYRPAGELRAPVTLFTARDNYVALRHDYGLSEVCTGEVTVRPIATVIEASRLRLRYSLFARVQVRQLAGNHRTILGGAAATAIAQHVSELLMDAV